MIHDILLSCLDLHSKRLPIEEFLVSDAVSTFLHPCEKKILQDIVVIINLLRDSARFAKIYGSNQIISLNSSMMDTDEPLQNGLYLKALANGFEAVIAKYYGDVAELERRYLQNPEHSLIFIYQQLQVYEPLALFLRRILRGIRSQKLHGCAIIQFLYQNTQHGDRRIHRAMRMIQSTVNVVFLKQLAHWILYAKVVDAYGEFFIQCSEVQNNSTLESDKGTSTGSGRQTTTTVSDTASTYADIWHFEICYEFLPHYLPASWAEKVLFIGQTVLIFKVDNSKCDENSKMWNKSEKAILRDGDSLWNEKEHVYFSKIQALQNDDDINTCSYERVIDEIKQYVTTRLSEIAINQADLVQQLRLIKDFYLLGRGELYLEFIRQTYVISRDENNENKLRDFVRAFETAAHSVGVSEDLEQFSLCISKTFTDADETTEFGLLQHVYLQYKINWPLHLLFSPKVIERYNVLFRFLLLIKRIQFELHAIWCMHTRTSKQLELQCVSVLHLRNQLMFFIDNLQYYIQVDVLESQFSILLNTVLNKADFEQIQKAHSVFQANVLSLCFLLMDDDATKLSMMQSNILPSHNPVYVILDDIFHLCEEFCALLNDKPTLDGSGRRNIDQLDMRFGNLMEQLISLLVGLKTAPSTTPLSQLLLRLDFNNWFSVMKKQQNQQDTSSLSTKTE